MSRRVDARDRLILRLAVPALATLAIEPLYVLVDTAIVGHLGRAPLGGLALASTVLNTSFFVFNFLAYGTTARAAYLEGSGDARGAAAIATQGLWLSGLLGAVLVVVLAGAARPLAAAMGGSGPVLHAGTTYLRISALGAPLVLVTLVGNGYLRGVQDTRTPLWVVLGANVLNVVIEVVLVYGFDLGVAGSAWGTVAAQATAAGVFLAILARRIRGTGASLALDGRELARLVRFGRHLLVRTGSLFATLTLATAVAARLGTATLGGHQIALQVETFLALVVDGLAIAAQAMIGNLLGGGDVTEARATGRRLIELGLVLGGVLAAVLLATSGVLPAVFSGDGLVRHRATLGLVVVALLQLPASVVFVIDGVLIGAADTRFQQWANVAAFVAFLPCALVVLHWRLGIVGLWAGLTAWMLARLVANALRFAGSAWTASAGA